jgi:DNA-binding winged helix-turn-helix (wHTH) protein
MRYTFNDFTVDTNQYELNHAGEAVHLEPQVLELLVLLIEQRDGVVSKETINDQVWNGRVVSDSALSSRIKALRQALGDDGRSQHTIRTIHKKGFRFVADVKESRLKLTKGNVRPIRD